MRLERLALDRFGHFTDKQFDFGPQPEGTPDFHIVHGPNEAGKTTTMEAWLRFLYGYARGEPYGFRHQRENLSVTAWLNIDGQTRCFRRLPRKNQLLDENGAVLPEAALSGALGGTTAETYRSLFCLDDATIESGGEEIVRARGDIGRLLFTATAGAETLSEVLDGLRGGADTLYRKGAPTTRVHVLKKALRETEAQIRAQDVSVSALRKLRTDRDAAQAREEAVSAERRALLQRAARTEAEIAALPMLAELRALETALEPLANHPADPGITADGVLALLQEAARADNDIQRLDRETARLTGERTTLPLAPEVLALADPLTALDPLYHRATGGAADLGKRRQTAADLLAEMGTLARSLTDAPEVDPLAFVPSEAALAQLEERREALRAARALVQSETQEVADLREALAEAQAGPDEAPDAIAQVFADVPVQRLAMAEEMASKSLQQARETARAALDALALPGQSFDTAPDLPISPEEAEAQHRAWQDAGRQLTHLTEETARHTARRTALEREIAGLSRLADDPATRTARQERDTLWQAHRDTLTPETARAFEAAMLRLDALMEARLDKADALAALRQAESALAEAHEAETATATARAEAEKRVAALTAAYDATQTGAGLARPLPLASLADWLRRAEAARSACRALDREADRQDDVLSDARAAADRLRPLLGSESTDFSHLARLAQERLEAWQARAEAARRRVERREDLARRLESRERRLARAEATQKEAETAWQACLAATLPDGTRAEALLATLKPLHRLRELSGMRDPVLRQIAGIEEDRRRFHAAMQPLPELPGADETEPEARFRAALTALDEARSAEDRQAALDRRLGEIAEERASSEQSAQATARQVESLLQAFPGPPQGGPDALRRAVQEAERARDLRQRIDTLARRIVQTLSCGGLDEARERLASRDLPTLEAERAETAADLDRVEDAVREAIAARTEAEAALKAVTGGAEVAELEARATVEAMQVTDAALDHLRLSLGHRLAEEALRRYRDRHRSGMMQATETAFAALTNGAYRQLRTEMEGTTEVLRALDASGTPKQVGDMSKGTRFQLYLALRAAAYEELAQQGLCLPFFCDDIFETFDEDRTRAACRVMARIGMTGQAIYLTHHRHVVEIAREVCGDALRVHDLRETGAPSL
ncbi:YhaN family protein [Ponticoccus alexandrii]|uniref:AAA family ATPase n=1 Tax=Ponticoccus alexandrii TaxID=1943633 RepID=A0ABX7F7I1_9RHOB|nr:YhaN family protein [Ponticoccus alexandrii]ETA49803.1 hypothetical protein P279_22845 [Rhodobacteraceae bacterium PD-2]QRF66089.1 AAA family ATPase [Ponticoccus alexandrii]